MSNEGGGVALIAHRSSLIAPSVSVVVPAHVGGPLLRRSLASLAGAVPPPDEIIVVADDAAPEIAALAVEAGARCVNLDDRRGPARARNVGAREASGEVLLFVDSDVAVHADAIAEVRAAFAGDARLAAVFGSYDDRPPAPGFFSQWKNLFHHYVHQVSRCEASTFWAGCGAVRRDVFLAAGGFDESFDRPSVEDIELGYRLRRSGWRIELRKSLLATHLKAWTLASLLRSDVLDRALPWTGILLRERSLLGDLNLRPADRASGALACAILAALCVAPWRPAALVVVLAAAILLLLVLNADLYRFFHRKRGLGFALRAIAWHWVYLVYSSLAFAAGVVRFARLGMRRRAG
jgi:GT2 family glycosyltransferase